LVAGNKENSKKLPNETITAASGPKMSLKAREFGKEITNAASSVSNNAILTAKNTHSHHSITTESN
jgi:hypothetical protein